MSKAPSWWPAYVGLGSNLDDPVRQVTVAAAALAELPNTRVVLRSSLYRSPPMGPKEQPDYVNAVLGLLTQLHPADLLAALKGQERAQGRQPLAQRWGPRRIDLDLLVFGERNLDEPGLRVPHSGIATRAFVVAPLAEIAPDLWVPGLGRVAKLVKVCDLSQLTRIETSAE